MLTIVDAIIVAFSETAPYAMSMIKLTNLLGAGVSMIPSDTPLIEMMLGSCQFLEAISLPQVTVLSKIKMYLVTALLPDVHRVAF